MHMTSKKYLTSAELEHLRKSRNPTSVISGNEEVQTNEEAQVHVHDLELFVTVQILDDTPAALSLGKLCEEDGCTCAWASGQKPHLTKNGKRILCKTENIVPVFVPGLSSSSSSSSPSSPHDSSSTSLSPAKLRSDDAYQQAPRNRRDHPKNQTKIKNEDNQQARKQLARPHGVV